MMLRGDVTNVSGDLPTAHLAANRHMPDIRFTESNHGQAHFSNHLGYDMLVFASTLAMAAVCVPQCCERTAIYQIYKAQPCPTIMKPMTIAAFMTGIMNSCFLIHTQGQVT